MHRPVGHWQMPLSLSDGQPNGAGHKGKVLPTFLRIARALSGDIERGRLLPGHRLPSSRALANDLNVHRNTALAAYRELEQEGWIESRAGTGTFVAKSLPERTESRLSSNRPQTNGLPDTSTDRPDTPGFELNGIHARWPGMWSQDPSQLLMYGGLADLRLLPARSLARAYRRAALNTRNLGYGEAAGSLALRTELASMLTSSRGLSVCADDIVVTRGSQMALSLAARAVLAPGDRVAVEQYGYPPVWDALRQAGAELVPIPVDGDGLHIERLAESCASKPIRAVYLTPHHQYPTTVQLSPARRLALLSLAQTERIAIFEDDYDHEYQYEGKPRLPLAAADPSRNVVYVGTLSKVLAPALRIGYLVAARTVVDRVIALRAYLDRQGDQVGEAAVAELMADGELQRHIWRTRRIYQHRRDLCAEVLQATLGNVLNFVRPPGGMALWAKVFDGTDVTAWLQAAQSQGVAFQTGGQAAFAGDDSPFARFGYACLNDDEIREAVRRLARAHSAL